MENVKIDEQSPIYMDKEIYLNIVKFLHKKMKIGFIWNDRGDRNILILSILRLMGEHGYVQKEHILHTGVRS